MPGRHHRLNWLNFFAADVGDGVGPFLAVYLISTSHWDKSSVGVGLLVLNLSTVIAQTPAGWLIDHTRYKRFLIAAAALTIGACVMVPPLLPQAPTVLIACALIGMAAAVIPPAIAAITLGIVGPKGMTKQTGSNQAFNHGGNVFTAVVIGALSFLAMGQQAGTLGYFALNAAAFVVIAAVATGAAIMVLLIPERTIDHDIARGGLGDLKRVDGEDASTHKREWLAVFTNRPLLIFIFCVGLFHLANASMLPMAGQKLAESHNQKMAMIYMSICIIIAQVVMVGVAILIGLRSDKWGRKRFLLLGFAVLPLRGLLFSQADDAALVMLGQVLDGIGAGVYGVIVILVVADLTRGTGVFNFASGVVITIQGLGASVGSWLGEVLADKYGYGMSYAVLTGLAVLALLVLAVAMPETHPDKIKPSRLPSGKTLPPP